MQNTSFDSILSSLVCFGKKIAIVDVESTGGDLYLDRLTEVAIILIEENHVDERSWLINPQKKIPPFVESLTGISNEMVKEQPIFADVVEEIYHCLKDSILVAHNVHFDYGFLRAAFSRENIALSNHVLCSVKLSRKIYPEFRKHNLDSIIERMQIELPSRHRALPDAQAILVFLAKSLEAYGNENLATQMEQVLQPKRLPEELKVTIKEAVYRLPDDFGFYAFFDKEQNLLFSHATERIFLNCCERLSKLNLEQLNEIDSVYYCPTVGILSAQIHLALWESQYKKDRQQQGVTVVLWENEQGWLQAKVEPMLQGEQDTLHYGYFPNPKAAKKILFEFARENNLCMNQLGLTHPTPVVGSPCAEETVGLCLGACVGREEAQSHNLRVQKALSSLPIKGWYFANPVKLVETHPISLQQDSFFFNKGLLLQKDGPPFFDAGFLPLIKRQVKSSDRIKVCQIDVDNER